MSEEKKGWVQSSIGNKIGTILWAVAGLIYLVISFMFFSVGAEGALGSLGVSWLITGILYIAVTVGMFLTKDICSAFAKVWGVINLISAVILIVTAVVAVLVVFKLIESMLGFDLASILPIDELLGEFEGGMLFIPIGYVLSLILSFVASLMITTSENKKSRLVALILFLFTGMMGGHLMYVKRNAGAAVRIIMTVTIILMPVSAILCIIDFIKILIGKFCDKEKNPVVAWV